VGCITPVAEPLTTCHTPLSDDDTFTDDEDRELASSGVQHADQSSTDLDNDGDISRSSGKL